MVNTEMYNIDDILRSLSSYLGLPAPVRLLKYLRLFRSQSL